MFTWVLAPPSRCRFELGATRIDVAVTDVCVAENVTRGPLAAVVSDDVLFAPVMVPSACSTTKSPDGLPTEIVFRTTNWLWNASIP